MVVTFKLYNWGARKIVNIEKEVALGKKYVLQNSFGQFIGIVDFLKREEMSKKSSLQISGENSEESNNTTPQSEDYLKVVREATQEDLEKAEEYQKEEQKTLRICRDKIKQYNLLMKLVGESHSLDGSSMVIAFIAENRVDFRELVRDLSHTFQKAVRLEQIGSRDEARIVGGFGPCGRPLCCSKFNGPLKSINTEMAKMQQIAHRGSERISGPCGRLLCCLAYELENYETLDKKMPRVGETIKTASGKGKVKNSKVLQQKILVEFDKSGKMEEKWYDLKDVEKVL
ncbi:MAG: regulatory iron-sulfur-containing complex subunit RicT [Patescibacteria group bacterium]|nr:regulatory iron-sulfur-containing complex subunit RicT [Patescibacteria group bacterium]